MYTSTDIPDWCLAEVLGQSFEESKFRGPTSDQIVKMYEKSPVSRIDRAKAPTLIALGMADLRVPPSQGKSFRKKNLFMLYAYYYDGI
jgi:acylaminoacyl-peptidase